MMIHFSSFLCLLCLALPASGLDREAFSFTRYELEARMEPWQQRLGVRGKLTLRNDSDLPQRNLVLQISSTLSWSSIQLGGKPVQFLSQPYNSDIDHTGALSEAIVTLPHAAAPGASIELEIGYEGVIGQDSTRLTRMGLALESAQHSDWDQITNSFSIVRGIGYVAWYPIATQAVQLTKGNTVFEEVGRWKRRQSSSEMKIDLCLANQDPVPTALMNGLSSEGRGSSSARDSGLEPFRCSHYLFSPVGLTVPTFAVAHYKKMEKPEIDLYYLPGNDGDAENYALAVEETVPVVRSWFEGERRSAKPKPLAVVLADRAVSPFVAGNMLLLPSSADDTVLILSAVRQFTQAMVSSPRPWIFGGLPRYAQVNYIELRKGHETAIRYLENHRLALVEAEKQAAQDSLLEAKDELYLETKAMYVWWMLKEMVGENALHAALRNYRAEDDNDRQYMEKLIAAQSHRNLGWFFDDWVYHNRGLPDLHIASVYSHQQGNAGYMVTVTIENRGGAGANVPVTVHGLGGENTQRLTVPGRAKATVRILAASSPREVTVNDGSVPELGRSNQPYPISASSQTDGLDSYASRSRTTRMTQGR